VAPNNPRAILAPLVRFGRPTDAHRGFTRTHTRSPRPARRATTRSRGLLCGLPANAIALQSSIGKTRHILIRKPRSAGESRLHRVPDQNSSVKDTGSVSFSQRNHNHHDQPSDVSFASRVSCSPVRGAQSQRFARRRARPIREGTREARHDAVGGVHLQPDPSPGGAAGSAADAQEPAPRDRGPRQVRARAQARHCDVRARAGGRQARDEQVSEEEHGRAQRHG
jgi:hypothetical protein